MIFSYFILFDLFNVNEHLAVPFVELAIGGSRMGHLRFFCLHWITCLRISTVMQAYSYLLLEISVTCISLSVCMVDQTQMYSSFISPSVPVDHM